ncbi:hypothetical protein HF086_011996 [Spodoptera exigua]|uniref:Uncharacterized protein n=1 Tax=Spodoptera exigua TaxID=7107 RepID=A0A922SHR4_SPOEX|nr:hypothetical protein HF086_011996 [Spodoptera exigua]
MTSEKTGIYHWKLGDISLARVCKKVYSNVQVVKDEHGLFYDDKGINIQLFHLRQNTANRPPRYPRPSDPQLHNSYNNHNITLVLGISTNDDGSLEVTEELCYYVETCNTKNRFWLPYTCMFLAERSRPFYGPAHKAPKISPPKTASVPRKRKIKEDLTVPLNVKLNKKEPDLNVTYDITHTPLKQGRYENAFKEFIRRGKELLFDQYYEFLLRDVETNKDCLDYLMNVDASTEDKFEMVIKATVSEKEIENYLRQCWRYNFVHKQMNMDSSKDASDSSVNDRKNPPQKPSKPVTLVEKILSSTRTICSVKKDKENTELCPSCMWGPRVG